MEGKPSSKGMKCRQLTLGERTLTVTSICDALSSELFNFKERKHTHIYKTELKFIKRYLLSGNPTAGSVARLQLLYVSVRLSASP